MSYVITFLAGAFLGRVLSHRKDRQTVKALKMLAFYNRVVGEPTEVQP